MILFDFDGVLVDSVNEIALSAYNLVTDSTLCRLQDLPAGYLDNFIANKHILLGPSRLVPLARWCLARLEEGKREPEFLPKEVFLRDILKDDSPKIADVFFSVRQRLMDNHPDEWLELNHPFPKIWDTVKNLDGDSFSILTYKNLVAVKKICSHYGLNLREDQILSGEGGRSKKENILQLDRLRGATGNYTFIDDNLENLSALSVVLPGRIAGTLASWGYNTPEDHATARNQGFSVLSQEEFVARIHQNTGSN